MSTETRRVIGLVTAVAAAVCLVIAVFTHAWLVSDARRLHFGLRTLDSDGVMWTNHEVIESALENGHQNVVPLFPVMGMATLVLGLVSAAFLVAWAAVRRTWLASLTRLALGGALVAAIVFVVVKPKGPAFGVAPGWSTWLFAAGIVAGVAATGGISSGRPRGGAPAPVLRTPPPGA